MSAKGLEAIVRAMRDDERERMPELLLEAMAGELPPEGDEARDACPRCGCTHVVRRGRDADGGQRWLCRGCGRTFRASTGRTLATTRLPTATWHLYARLMAGGATPGGCAAACGVSLRTSFSMRHRLLEVMGSSLPAFEAGPGCAARADETLVPDSLSGNHTLAASGFSMPRPARRRGGDGATGGAGGDKAGVLVCANVRGGVFLREARGGKLGVGSAREALAGCALAGAVVSTDRQRGYVRALAEMGVAAHQRFASSGPRAPLNLVNAIHSAPEAFLARFRGVSTRRLHGYLVWLAWLHEARRSDDPIGLLGDQLPCSPYRLTWRQRVAAPYPFHPELAVSG